MGRAARRKKNNKIKTCPYCGWEGKEKSNICPTCRLPLNGKLPKKSNVLSSMTDPVL